MEIRGSLEVRFGFSLVLVTGYIGFFRPSRFSAFSVAFLLARGERVVPDDKRDVKGEGNDVKALYQV